MVHEVMAIQCASSALHAQVAGNTITVGRWICRHFHEKCLFRRALRPVFDIIGV